MTNSNNDRNGLFFLTAFAKPDIYDKDGNFRGSIKSNKLFSVHMVDFLRLFSLRYGNSLEYVVGLPHDYDLYEKEIKDKNGDILHKKGDVKDYHWHVVIKFKNSMERSLSSLQKLFYTEFNIQDHTIYKNGKKLKQEHLAVGSDEGSLLGYLHHNNKPDKAPYGLNNMYFFFADHRNKGKLKTQGFEDIGKIEPNDGSSFWVSRIEKQGVTYLGQGGQSGVQELEQADEFDQFGQLGTKLGIVWPKAGTTFDKAEFRLTRNSGHAVAKYLALRKKKMKVGNQTSTPLVGAKKNGSARYKREYPLNKRRNHPDDVTIIDMINYDLSRGTLLLKDVQPILEDEYGALGDTAYTKNASAFLIAFGKGIEAKVSKINSSSDPAKRDLLLVYTTGYGGAGKTFINQLQGQILSGENNANDLTATGKGKTADLHKTWGGEAVSIGADVDGSSYEPHEFTQVFDTDHAPATVSGRNNNTPFLPNFMFFNNSYSLRAFVTTSMTFSDENYCAITERNGEVIKDRYKLNDHTATINMTHQMLRRMPVYQKFTTDQYDMRIQHAQVFVYVPALKSHVLYDAFDFTTLDSIADDITREAEAMRVASRLCDDIKAYDFTGRFGHKQTILWDKVKYKLDFKTETVVEIKTNDVLMAELNDYRRSNQIPFTNGLTDDQYKQFLITTKRDFQLERAELVRNANFNEVNNKRLSYLNYCINWLLRNIKTEIDDIDTTTANARAYMAFLQAKIDLQTQGYDFKKRSAEEIRCNLEYLCGFDVWEFDYFGAPLHFENDIKDPKTELTFVRSRLTDLIAQANKAKLNYRHNYLPATPLPDLVATK